MPKFWQTLKDLPYVESLGVTAADLPELTDKVLKLFRSGEVVHWLSGFIRDHDNIPNLVALLVEYREDKDGFAVLFLYRSILKLPSESSTLIKTVRKEYRKILDIHNDLLDKDNRISALLDRLGKYQRDLKFRNDVADFVCTLRVAAIAHEGNNLIHSLKRGVVVECKTCRYMADLKALMAFPEQSEHFVVWRWVHTRITAMHYDNLERYFDRGQLKTKHELMNAIKNVADLDYDVLMTYHSCLYRLYLSPYYALVADHQDVFSFEYEMFHPRLVDILQIHKDLQKDQMHPKICQQLPERFFKVKQEASVESPAVADDEVLLNEAFDQMGID